MVHVCDRCTLGVFIWGASDALSDLRCPSCQCPLRAVQSEVPSQVPDVRALTHPWLIQIRYRDGRPGMQHWLPFLRCRDQAQVLRLLRTFRRVTVEAMADQAPAYRVLVPGGSIWDVGAAGWCGLCGAPVLQVGAVHWCCTGDIAHVNPPTFETREEALARIAEADAEAAGPEEEGDRGQGAAYGQGDAATVAQRGRDSL